MGDMSVMILVGNASVRIAVGRYLLQAINSVQATHMGIANALEIRSNSKGCRDSLCTLLIYIHYILFASKYLKRHLG
jgi:hypothetical protein